MSTCQYILNNNLVATGMPGLADFLFQGNLERLLPGEKVPKLVGQVEGGVRFSKMLTPEAKNLVILHNTSLEGLENYNKEGRIPSPSLAISRIEHPLANFGKISLIGSTENFAPDRTNKIFNTDVYSARYPRISYIPNEKEIKRLNANFFSKEALELKDYGSVLKGNDLENSQGLINYLEDKLPVIYEYLASKGITPKIVYEESKKQEIPEPLKKYINDKDGYAGLVTNKNFINDVIDFYGDTNKEYQDILVGSMAEAIGKSTEAEEIKIDKYKTKREMESLITNKRDYHQWIENAFGDIVKSEKIFTGHTYSGARKYTEHNIDNVLKIMKKQGIRGAEGFNFGVPSVRAQVAIEYKKLKDIQKDREKIVSKEEMEKLAKVTTDEYSRIESELRNTTDIYANNTDNFLEDSAKRGISWAENEYNIKLDDTLKKDITALFSLLREYPTEYFEIKPQRIVNLSEFSGAVIPEGKEYDRAVEILKRYGISDIRRYKGEADRARAINEFGSLFFSKGKTTPKPTGSTVAQVKSWLPKQVTALMNAGKLKVVQSVSDLPEFLRGKAEFLASIAWHGSRSDFDYFSHNYIGEGEGAAGWGYGTYLTKTKAGAVEYKRKLQRERGEGKVYKVEIPDIKLMLDLDKYGDEQSPYVKKALRKIPLSAFGIDGKTKVRENNQFSKNYGEYYTMSEQEQLDEILSSNGRTIYDKLVEQARGWDSWQQEANASKTLLDAGIKGNTHTGFGDRDYVVFNEDDLRIIAKYSLDKLAGTEALYDPKADTIYLVADMLTKRNTNIVLSHELVHRAEAIDPLIQRALTRLESSIKTAFDNAAKGIGTANDLAAYQRVIEAQTAKKDQLSEFIAYKVTEFLSNPANTENTIANAIKRWISAIKVFLLRNGLDMGFVRSLNESDFVAMSRYGALVNELSGNFAFDSVYASTTDQELESLVKQYASESGAPTRTEMAEALRQYREVEAKYFNADGSKKAGAMIAPNGMATNLNKRQWIMVRTDNFINWFGDWENSPESASKVVDNVTKEPLVVYHGTGSDFNEFMKEELGTLTRAKSAEKGFFFSDNPIVSESYTAASSEFGFITVFADKKQRDFQKDVFKTKNYLLGLKGIGNETLRGFPDWYGRKGWIDEIISKTKRYPSNNIEEITKILNNLFDKRIDVDTKELLKIQSEMKGYQEGGNIMPVFLNVRNPIIHDFKSQEYRDTTFDDLLKKAIKSKKDGSVFSNVFDGGQNENREKIFSTVFTAFNPNQIKSATSNTGTFSVGSNDIRFSRRQETLRADLQSVIDNGKLPENKWLNTDAIITNLVDSTQPLRVWSRSLPDQTAAARLLDAYDLGSTQKQIIIKRSSIKFKRKISKAISVFAKDNGMKFDAAFEAIGDWASMRYALESNQPLADYSTTDMQMFVDAMETKFGKGKLEQAIAPILEMNQWRLEHLDAKNGKDVTALLATPNYVPLLDHNGIQDSYSEFENSASFAAFKPFRDKLKSIYKAIKTDNPALTDNDIKDEYGLSSDKKGNVRITDKDAQEAMTDLSNEKVPTILKPFAAITRFQSHMVIAMLPGFAPTNMIRDVGERSENLRTRVIPGYETVDMNAIANQGIMRATTALRNINQMMGVLAEGTTLESKFSPDNGSQLVQDFREYLKLGASSTYGDYLASNKEDLTKELKKIGGIREKIFDPLMLWNNAFEMISGFSMYQAMKYGGIDETTAAATSLNLMNFTKRGKMMSPLRALFMFASPIAQGAYQLSQTLKTKRGKTRLAAYTLAAMALYSLLRGMDGDDDDELGYNRMDEQSNFSLYRGIPVPLGDGDYFYIPVPFGMTQLAWATGVNFVRTSLGSMTLPEMLGEEVLLGVRAVAPVAPAEGSIMKNPAIYVAQTITPQAIKPIMNVAMDVNAFMSPLTNSRFEREDKPKSQQGRPNTPQEYKDVAIALSKASNGYIDMYPEQLRELARGYGAGLFNEIVLKDIENSAKEERGLKTVSPLIDRWYKASNDDQIKQKLYYVARDKMNQAIITKENGGELTEEEIKLAKLGETLKKKEASTRGKYAAATKLKNKGYEQKADRVRKVADRMHENYVNYAFDEIKKIEED